MRRRNRHEEKEVDLAALVDILSNMLFFLLATVSFLQLKTLNAAVPALSSGAVTTGKAVDVSVEITSAGYVLKATGTPADPSAGFKPVERVVPRTASGSLDTKTLTKELWEVKKLAPETKTIMLFPEQGIVFDDIVKTMDATREMPSLLDPSKKVPLFTRPVLSELVSQTDAPRDAPTKDAP